MPRKAQGWVTFQISEEERQILEEFCQNSQRTKTEILRELVRGLKQYSAPPILLSNPQEKAETKNPEFEIISPKKTLKVSSRNVLKGVVK